MIPPSPPVSRCRTQGFAGYNLAWSPFFENKLAVASSANYGLVGNGRLHIMSLGPGAVAPSPGLMVEKMFDTQDGLYDLAWSEAHENQIVTASGDGSIKLWDVALNDHPIRNWAEHTREVFSVDWNNIKKEIFASSSWDCSVKVWHPERKTSLTTIQSHTACVYACAFSPHNPDLLATGSGDGHLRLFDLRQPPTTGVGGGGAVAPPTLEPVATLPVGGEVLCLDWNKYRPLTVATGSTDRGVKVWDLRNAIGGVGKTLSTSLPGRGQMPVAALLGHEYAVRKVAFSPHSANLLASASYDMTARVWDVDAGVQGMASGMPAVGGSGAMRRVYDAHTEFVVGIGWSLFHEGLVASTAWDCETHLWGAMG
ncbi:WD40 repeat-like protein [Violaceomyces palustris]|uniref:WD40 repeat-like protein n=1 Tax=Violaceomyces palustris TaxID=1673888 RepID=A0ACD0NYZ6_9BASI|nr:WD40 repeat-like protein [Violaceomyces palustris]